MKNKAEKILFLLLITCSSCSSIYRFSVEMQEPALFTLPASAQNVLILNNTVTQTENYGIERKYDGRSIRPDFPLSLDSMIWASIAEIATVLTESDFFNTIAVYKQPLRTDTEWLTTLEISPEMQSEFFEENYDALLVIDRLLFSLKENVKTIKTGFFTIEQTAFVDMRVDGIITCSMYTYGNEKTFISFTVTDSLYVKSTINNDSILLFKEIPEFIMDELSRQLGNQVANRFIPMWRSSERLLFTNLNPRMKEALSYAADHQWDKAELIWITELEKKTKPADKAKIAYNLAITNEMKDKFVQALEWAQKAKEYLKNANPNNYSQEIELTDKTILELERRIRNNRLLDLQWGKE